MAAKYKYPGIKPPPLDNPAPSGAKLGDKIEATFTRFVQKVISWAWEFTADLLVDIADNIFHILQPGMDRMSKPLFDSIKSIEGLPPELKATFAAIEAEKGESKFFAGIFSFLAYLIPFVTGGLSPLGRKTQYIIDYHMRTGRPAPNEAVDLFKRGLLTEDQTRGTLGELGVTLPHIEAILKAYDTAANPDDLIFGLIRGLYSESEFKRKLIEAGIPGGLHDIYLEQSKLIPQVQDLIRMMVREAFNDDLSGRFGHDEDYPAQANEFLSKIGLTPEWGKAYWRAHWQLPSPTQVYEMLHRGLVSQDDLREFLKTADYAPFWREKLEKLSYNILTRVDLRRLYQAGLIDRDYVLSNYKAQGYTDQDAELLTQFAEAGQSSTEKDLTKADVIGLYQDGLQDRGATSADLVKMGYDPDEAEDLLTRADFDIQKALKTDAINWIEERYLLGELDKNAAGAELSLAGLPTVSVERYLLEFERKKQGSKAKPTNAEAKRLFTGGIITEADYREILESRNYDQKYIDWFVREAQAGMNEGSESGNA